MSPRDWQYRVEDLLEAIASAQAYIEGMTFQRFSADRKTIRAAAYELAVIGEAVRNLPAELRDSHSEIPWGRMQAFRNVLIHEYFRVDIGILWQTIKHDLPPLEPLLRRMLEGQMGGATDVL
jgi:uncharacterized protein with HEPN domain